MRSYADAMPTVQLNSVASKTEPTFKLGPITSTCFTSSTFTGISYMQTAVTQFLSFLLIYMIIRISSAGITLFVTANRLLYPCSRLFCQLLVIIFQHVTVWRSIIKSAKTKFDFFITFTKRSRRSKGNAIIYEEDKHSNNNNSSCPTEVGRNGKTPYTPQFQNNKSRGSTRSSIPFHKSTAKFRPPLRRRASYRTIIFLHMLDNNSHANNNVY